MDEQSIISLIGIERYDKLRERFETTGYRNGRTALLRKIRGIVEGMKKEKQFPLADKVMDRVYDCDVNAFNAALQAILQEINKLQDGKE